MADNEMSNEVTKALEDYFNSPVNVYECGKDEDRPQRIQDRPFLKSLPNGHTIYLQKTAETQFEGSFAVSLDAPIPGGSIESETENSKFLNEMQERFRNAKEDVNLIIIDPDVIRGRYTMDENPRRSLLQSFYSYLSSQMDQDGVSKAIPLSHEDYAELMEAAVTGNSPLSLGVPVKDLGRYAVVISTQPDMPMHDMFTAIPGATIRMEKKNIGKEHVRDMILLHELGHALDTLNDVEKTDKTSDSILKRHRTECVADAHSILQTAKKYGNTDVGKLVSDIRIDNTAQGIAYIQGQMQGATEEDDLDEGMALGFRKILRPNYEGQKYFASPELKDYIKTNNLKAVAKNVDEVPAPNSTADTIDMLGQNAMLHNIAEVLGSVASYTTSFCADEAIKVANKKLKDGSLKDMSDKEIHALAEDIVAKKAFSKEQITGLVMGVMTGEPTPEFESIVKRYEKAANNFPADPQKEVEMQMQAMGLPVPQPELTAEESLNLKNWWEREMAEKIEEKGASREALLDTVEKEKNEVRKEDSLLNQYKIAVMNQVFMGSPDAATDKAKTFGTVRDTLKEIEAPAVTETGLKAVEAFVKAEMKALDTGLKAVELASSRDIATMTPDAFAKSVSKEGRNAQNLYKEEKRLQALAFAIRKDPEAWEIVSKSPELAQQVEEKAKQKHPTWVEKIHMNLGQKDMTSLSASKAEIDLNKKLLAVSVINNGDLSQGVNKTVLKKLSMSLPKEKPESDKKLGFSTRSKKRKEYTESGDFQWNLIKNKRGRS